MFCSVRSLFALGLLLVAASVPTVASAADENYKAQVVSMLNEGWSDADGTLSKAEASFAQAKSLAPADIRANYAWALIKMKNGRAAEAAAVLDTIMTEHPAEHQVRQAQIWIHASLREYPPAIQSLVTLGVRLPKADEDVKDEDRAAAKFLGQMFGYLTGPGSDQVQDDKLEAKEKLVAGGLTPSLKSLYDESKAEVTKKFVEYVQNPPPEPVATPAPADFGGVADAEQAAILSGNGAFDPNDPRIAELKKKFLTEQAPLQKKLASLAKDYNFLATQGATLRASLEKLEKNAKAKETQANKEKNQTKRVQLNAEAKKAEDMAKKSEHEFNRLKGEAEKLKREAAPIKQELNAMAQKYKADASRLVGGVSKPVAGKTPEPPKPVAAVIPAAPAPPPMSSKEIMESLVTYLPFPLEAEKQRVIESLSK